MQFDSHHNPLRHALLPCHLERVCLKRDKEVLLCKITDNKYTHETIEQQIQSYPPPEMSVQRVMMPLKSNACTLLELARWHNQN